MFERIGKFLRGEKTPEEQLQDDFDKFLKRQQRDSETPLELPDTVKAALERGETLRSFMADGGRILLSTRDGIRAVLWSEDYGNLIEYKI